MFKCAYYSAVNAIFGKVGRISYKELSCIATS